MTLHFLQNYWWLLISVLAALLVMMLFVQGGQSMLFQARTAAHRTAIIRSMGTKWELTFTTLVTFGGAFFAAFPLFYSTSFGGAYWLWMLILASFVLQAVSYEYRRKKGNLYGVGTYDLFLMLNGCMGCILLGVAVGTMVWGAEFTVAKANIIDAASPVISTWDNPSRGLEAICSWRNLLLGFTIFFLARVMSATYMLDTAGGDLDFRRFLRTRLLLSGAIFVVLFVTFAIVLLCSPAYHVSPLGTVEEVPYGYLSNFVTLWWAAVALLAGTVLVLCGLTGTLVFKGFRHGSWYVGAGTVLVVLSIFWVLGYNSTCYYPSVSDPASSLTIANSSSSHFTLTVMSYVSLAIPFVLAYIIYVWRALLRPDRTT